MSVLLPTESMTRNAAWTLYLELYADAKRTTPFDLTGYAAQSQLRAEESQTSALLADITVAIGSRDPVTEVFSADPGGNVLELSLSAATLAAITASEGWADVLIKPMGGDAERIGYFKAVIGDGETVWAA